MAKREESNTPKLSNYFLSFFAAFNSLGICDPVTILGKEDFLMKIGFFTFLFHCPTSLKSYAAWIIFFI